MTIGPAAATRSRWRAAIPIASLVLAAVAVGWHTIALAAGYLLNNYPFLSPDSYDWILEGVYLTRMLTGPHSRSAVANASPTDSRSTKSSGTARPSSSSATCRGASSY